MPAVWIGTSGYVYRHWRSGGFYPPGLRAADELAYVYFNNDREGHAPRDAVRLRELLRVER